MAEWTTYKHKNLIYYHNSLSLMYKSINFILPIHSDCNDHTICDAIRAVAGQRSSPELSFVNKNVFRAKNKRRKITGL